MSLYNKRVCVTGGAGFLGSFVVDALRARGVRDISVPRRHAYDLATEDGVRRLFEDTRPEIVFHLAAVVGGIGANQRHPGQFFYENAIMGIHLIEYARRFGVEKTIVVGTVCAYPALTPVPFREDSLWDGYPEETNAPYGLAKKMLLVQCQAYRQEYGTQAIYLLPVNLYGPRDNFDPASSHVIPALIQQCLDAKARGMPQIVCWGDGTPTREFLYAADAAAGLVCAAEHYDAPEPVNLGSGQEVSIADLAATVARLCGYNGRIVWDRSKPNGQMRRRLDTSRAREAFGWTATTPLEDGLRQTIAWYGTSLEQVKSVDAAGSGGTRAHASW